MTLGERVLLLRRRKRLTQDALADQAGVNKMTIWRLEHGVIQDMKGQVLAKMAVALDVCFISSLPVSQRNVYTASVDRRPVQSVGGGG